MLHSSVNPFFPNALLYPLKAQKNLQFFRCFQGVEKGCIGNNWVKIDFENSNCYIRQICI